MAFEAYDGSCAGPADPVVPHRRSATPGPCNYVATAPSDLGLARAYVSGYLDVDGDMFTALTLLAGEHVGCADLARAPGGPPRASGLTILRPIAPPPEEIRPGLWWGLRHSLARDSRAISHHYDVSNRFYEWILGPTMAYTCAVYPDDGRHPGGGPGGEGRPGVPQAGLAAGPAPPGRRMRVGDHGPPRRRALRGHGSSG